MKICMISPGLNIFTIQLVCALKQKQQDVFYILDQSEGKYLSETYPKYFSKVENQSMLIPKYKGTNVRKYWQIIRMIKLIFEKKIDIVHFQAVAMNPEYLITLLILKILKKPIVITLHDVWMHAGENVNVFRTFIHFVGINLANNVIVHGKILKQYLVDEMKIDSKLIEVIDHGNYDIYTSLIQNKKMKHDSDFKLLFFGRMKYYKGLDILLKSATIIKNKIKNIKIIIAGRGEELDKYLDKILADNETFELLAYRIDDKEVSMLFNDCTLVLLPYREASQSGPLHLAFSFGKPVVATNVGAIPESLTDGEEGLIVPPENPEAFASAVINILENPKLLENMKAKSHLKSKKYSWEGEIYIRTIETYSKAIRNKKFSENMFNKNFMQRWKKVAESIKINNKLKDRKTEIYSLI